MLARIRHRMLALVGQEEARVDEQEASRELEFSAPAPELAPLAAARGAELLHVRGTFIDTGSDDLPGTVIRGRELIGLTLEFAGRPALYLRSHGHGEGLTPAEHADFTWEGVETRDLDEIPPFAAVLGARLRELTLLSYRRHSCHVAVRLQFEGAELVLVNAWDDIEAYDGLVTKVRVARSYQHLYEYPYDRKL